MAAKSYQIIFSGQLAENTTEDVAKENLQRLLKTKPQTVEQLFSRPSTVIKKDLDEQQAGKYVKTLRKAGVEVEVKPPPPSGGAALSLVPTVESATQEPNRNASDSAAHSQEVTNGETEADPYAIQSSQATAAESAFCRQCGVKLSVTEPVCGQCGAKQLVGKSRSRFVAGWLALLLGGLGIHRFYLGQWWGIIYFFTWPIAPMIAIVESIVFFCTSQPRWLAKYGNVQPVSVILLLVITIPVFVAIVGILAAVSIPAYVDYTARSQVLQVVDTVEVHKQEVYDFIIRTNFVPNSNLDAGLPDNITAPYLESLEIQSGGKLVATFDTTNSALSGKTLAWVPTVASNAVSWDCSAGTLEKRFRPPACRVGAHAQEQNKIPGNTIVSYDKRATVSAPKSWKVLDLHEEADIEVGNEYAEVYYMSLHEPKTDLPDFDLKRFANVVLENHAAESTDSKIEFVRDTAVNGLPALHYRVDSRVEGLDIVYQFVFLEGSDTFYQTLAWSLGSRYSGNSDKMDSIITSFREQ